MINANLISATLIPLFSPQPLDTLQRGKKYCFLRVKIHWDCDDFCIGETKRRLHDRKTGHFKALAKTDNTSAVAMLTMSKPQVTISSGIISRF